MHQREGPQARTVTSTDIPSIVMFAVAPAAASIKLA